MKQFMTRMMLSFTVPKYAASARTSKIVQDSVQAVATQPALEPCTCCSSHAEEMPLPSAVPNSNNCCGRNMVQQLYGIVQVVMHARRHHDLKAVQQCYIRLTEVKQQLATQQVRSQWYTQASGETSSPPVHL